MRENQEEWMELCRRAADELDPEKFLQLIARIHQLLEAKEERLRGGRPTTEPTD
jgi:hypothetical protein